MTQSDVTAYWEAEVCGTRFATGTSLQEQSQAITSSRYEVEPFIRDFARFDSSPGQRVLEVGVGAGTDFMGWLKTGADCYGVDATQAAIDLTRQRIEIEGVSEPVFLGVQDASALPFESDFFDVVYSYGVIHHAERTQDCLDEIARVLRPGGQARVMVYSSFSATGLMLWALYGLGKGRPLQSQKALVASHLESPGTKSFGMREFRRMAEGAGLRVVDLEKKAGTGDLLLMPPSAKYEKRQRLYQTAQSVYPRWAIRRLEHVLGLGLLLTAAKR